MTNKFLITEEVPLFFKEGLEKLGFDVLVEPHLSQNEIEQIIPHYDGLFIRGRIHANASLLEKATQLQYILRPGSGLDIIDQELAKQKEILLINSPEGNRDAVAEHSIGLMLSVLNNMHTSFEDLKKFNWTRNQSIGEEINQKTIGIIGYGNTGTALAKKLSGFDMTIRAYDKFKNGYGNQYVLENSLEEIFYHADIVSFHIPYNKSNHYLVDKQYLYSFRKNIVLLNTSRGKIVNTEDLLNAIQDRKVRAAGLDVLENEKLNSYSTKEKNLLKALIETKKVHITPHIAGKTTESERKIHSVLLEKLAKVFKN
jgi:D-3-phosphoglycerate dehydrogenase